MKLCLIFSLLKNDSLNENEFGILTFIFLSTLPVMTHYKLNIFSLSFFKNLGH